MVDPTPPRVAGSYLTARRGIRAWLMTRDPKRIGVLYLGALTLVFALGGLVALTLHIELFTPDRALMDAGTYNRALRLHGTVLTCLFIVPSVFASLGNFVLPLMLGTDNVALPRLNLAGFYLYLLGVSMTIAGCVSNDFNPVVGDPPLVIIGVFAASLSYLITAVEFVLTVHRRRAPAVTWRRMPHFAWALYGASLVLLVSAPFTLLWLLGSLLAPGMPLALFGPALHGDLALLRQLFGVHMKAVFCVAMLATWGILLEILSVHGKLDVLRTRVFSLGLLFVSIPSAALTRPLLVEVDSVLMASLIDGLITVQGLAILAMAGLWGARLHRADIQSTTAGWYVMAISFTTLMGPLVYWPARSRFSFSMNDTALLTGASHNTFVGIYMIAALAGLHHWWPKLTGTSFNERAGKVGVLIILIGLNLTFLAQALLGLQGMPRGYVAYLPEYQPLQQLSTVGAWVLVPGLGFVAINLLRSLSHGLRAPMNPWNARSLEWQVPSPPAEFNFPTPLLPGTELHDDR